MTGFGEARLEAEGLAYHVEIRSVNNRYLKTVLRLPDDHAFLESDLERLIREKLVRGSVTYRLYVRGIDAAAAADLNPEVMRAYIVQLRRATHGDEAGVTIDLATLATMPGVIQPHEVTEEEREHRQEIAEQLTREALDALVEMRCVEGQGLAKDLTQHCDVMRAALARVRERAPGVVAEYRDRLHARISELVAGSGVTLAQEDLIREVAVFADRSDISEELQRLEGHLEQFASAMDAGEAAGRKLDFIAQEMLREANTIGSKSGDAAIARDIIEIKSAIDRVKEQVQNVE